VRLALLLLVVGALSVGCVRYAGVEVPYVQTPSSVVTDMLRLASVGKDDVVYDLGSGDGRIVIAAAREFGASGVGVEIDPALVEESRAAAARAGVADRVRFVQQDLFLTDLRPATVVTLYLSPDMNARLRPKLMTELRAGSRVVSHQFTMGDWPPTRTVQVEIDREPRPLHLWVIPARP
jgi:hypothetical protein